MGSFESFSATQKESFDAVAPIIGNALKGGNDCKYQLAVSSIAKVGLRGYIAQDATPWEGVRTSPGRLRKALLVFSGSSVKKLGAPVARYPSHATVGCTVYLGTFA